MNDCLPEVEQELPLNLPVPKTALWRGPTRPTGARASAIGLLIWKARTPPGLWCSRGVNEPLQGAGSVDCAAVIEHSTAEIDETRGAKEPAREWRYA